MSFMYEAHPQFDQPKNLDARVWRFLDLPKFLSLLHSGSVHFARADQFEDPYEGRVSDRMNAHIREHDRVIGPALGQMANWIRTDTFISCWHLSEHESATMWKLYSGADVGLAVVTSYGKLRNALDRDSRAILLGVVRYGHDYGAEVALDVLARFMNKRKSFEHEKEVRAVIWRIMNNHPKSGEQYVPSAETGMRVEVDLNELVDEVLLAPTAPAWFVPVLSHLAAKLGYSFAVRQSSLYRLGYDET
jgi:hypothetical protein